MSPAARQAVESAVAEANRYHPKSHARQRAVERLREVVWTQVDDSQFDAVWKSVQRRIDGGAA